MAELGPPDRQTIPGHLTHMHGYDYQDAYTRSPVVLLIEHGRIHEMFTTTKINHTHRSEA